MKRLFILNVVIVIVMCGCAKELSGVSDPAPNTITEIPDSAVHIKSYTQSIHNGITVTDADFMLENEFTGYLILDVKYSSGSAKDMELTMVSPEVKTIIKIPNGKLSATYCSETDSFADGSGFQLSFASVSNYEATYEIYIVSTIDD